MTAKKCTKNCNAADLLFGRSRCRRRNIERRFVSNGNAYELVLGRFLNFLKIWYYICTSLLLTFKKKPRVLTYLDFSAKAGAHSRRYYERTRRIKWNCFNNRKLKLYSAVIRHLWSIYFGVHKHKKRRSRIFVNIVRLFFTNRQIFGFLIFYSPKFYLRLFNKWTCMNTCKKIIKRFQVAKSWTMCAISYYKRPKIFWAVAVWFL